MIQLIKCTYNQLSQCNYSAIIECCVNSQAIGLIAWRMSVCAGAEASHVLPLLNDDVKKVKIKRGMWL